jgi:CheY-like chemotaxis protein/CHASE3 domain sensor protein
LNGRAESRLRGLSLRTKLAATFASFVLLLAATSVGFFVAQNEQGDARRWVDHSYQVLLNLESADLAARSSQSAVRGYLVTDGGAGYIDQYERAAAHFDERIAAVRGLTADNPLQQERLPAIDKLMAQWRAEVAAPITALGPGAMRDEGRERVVAGMQKGYIDQIDAAIGSLENTENELLAQRTRRLQTTLTFTSAMVLVMVGLGLAMIYVATRITNRHISGPLLRLTGLMARLADGDHTIEVPHRRRSDEIGAIARALEAFRQLTIATYDSDWVKTGIAALTAQLQTARSEERFAEELVRGVALRADCGHALFFVLDEASQRLRALAGYGVADAAMPGLSVAIGEGLAGQCARDRTLRVLEQLPAGYARIHSGLGGTDPSMLLLAPLSLGEELFGVLELARFDPLDARGRRYIDELLPVVALSFGNLRRALKTQQLLAETQAQSEELQTSEEALRVQQEELRATNEALQGKTRQLEQHSAQLRASEEELKQQTEELQAANEAMNAKSATLREQNEILEILQRETQEKANALAVASRYKSEFLANMSHELRTPLNSLLILSKSLADNELGHLDAEEIESARVIHEGGTRLLALINDILDLSKVEAGKMDVMLAPLPIADFVETMRRNFRPVARERSLGFDIDVAPGLPASIVTDAGRLEQIANNLLGNAFKFTRQGEVRLSLARPAANLALPEGLDRAKALAISVRDTGIGIPAEKFGRIFQAFEQVDSGASRQFGGTGLGLSIARAMARLLGGDIVFDSVAGAGSTFTLLLPEVALAARVEPAAAPVPFVERPVAPRPPPLPPADAAPVGSIPDDRELIRSGDTVILIVEDDPVFARILADLIRRKGYRVLAAGDGESGLLLARQFRPSGVLLDVMLPGMDGWSVIDRLKADPVLKAIPVHFISATDEVARALEAGAIGFLRKPVTKAAVLDAFERLLHPDAEAKRRVLLVDDDLAARYAARIALSDSAAEIVEAGSAEAALVALAGGHFDCIVLDLGLPGISGFEFLERATQAGSLPPVVIHSARELTRDESLRLRQYTDSIVIKSGRSQERLLDEVSLFLHSLRPAPPLPPREVDTALDGRTALIIDDDMRNIFALSKALRAKGLKVLMAQDGPKALRQLEEHDDIDIALVDIMMPGMDGYETMRRIRAQPSHAKLPMIAVTAKAMRGDREKCLEAGANDYLSKPIDIDQLLTMMRVWVRPRA